MKSLFPYHVLCPFSLRFLRRTGAQLGLWKESWAQDLFFGMNVLHERNGVLRVGNEVEVLRVAKRGVTTEAMLSEVKQD